MPKDASVYARERSPFYRLSYYCPVKGKRVHVTTPFRLDDPQGHKKALRLAHEKSAEASAHRGASKDELWGNWVEAFISLNHAAGSRTRERYLGAWDWIRAYLHEKKLPVPAAIDYNAVIGFVHWRTSQRRNNGRLITRNTALCDVRVWSAIMTEAVRRGFCQGNPCHRLGLKREPTKERPELTDDDIAKIRAAVARRESHLPLPLRWMTISFEIALHQSIRLRATSMPLDHIDTTARTIRWRTKSRHGEERWVTKRLHANLVPLIDGLRAAGATMTCELPRMAAKLWWDLRREEGLSHTTFHSTRVSVVTRMARAGVPEQQAMAYVEHSSRIVHRIYQRLKAPDLDRAEQALNFSAPVLPAPPRPASAQTRDEPRASEKGGGESSSGR